MASNRFNRKRPLNKGPSICFPPPPPPPPELTPVVCFGSPIPSVMRLLIDWTILDNPPPFPPPSTSGTNEVTLSHIGELDGHQTWRGRFSSGRVLDWIFELSCGCGPTPFGWHLSSKWLIASKTRNPDLDNFNKCVGFKTQESPAPSILRLSFPPITDAADESSLDTQDIWCYTDSLPPA